MQISCDTKIIDATFEEITSESQVRTSAQTVKKSSEDQESPNNVKVTQGYKQSKSQKGDMYTSEDVAQILKVSRKTIMKWRTEKIFGCDILSEDMIDHNGVHYYFRDKIDQLAKVFRKDWRTAWAKPNDKSEKRIVPTNQNFKNVEKNDFFNEEPHNIEMEKFVLGSLLLKDGLIIPDIAAILSPDDFYRPEHKLIYNSILKLYHTIADLLNNKNENFI